MKIAAQVLAIGVVMVCVASCKKEAGEGGNSTIFGKIDKDIRVVLTNPATTQSTVIAADQDVYIIYGDHTSPDDRIQTNYNGEFEFRNLRPGNYTIYTFCKDTNAVVVPWDEDHMPISLSLEVSEKKQDVDAGTLTIYDVE